MHERDARGATPTSDAAMREGHRWLHVDAVSGRVLPRFFSPDSHRRGSDTGQIGSYRPNICVFQPEKGNRPIRRKKKKKNLKPKISVDLICCLHRLNPFLFLLLLFCFFVFFFLFFCEPSIP